MRIEFQAWVCGWRRAERQTQLQGLLEKTDDQLLVATERCSDKLMLFLPQILFPESDDKAEFGDNGWWYTPMRIERIAMCVRCGKNCTMEQFPIEDGEQRTSCLTCAQTRRRQRKAVKWMWTGERNGLVCTLADPRYAGRGDDRSGGDVVMDAGRLRQVLEHTSAMAEGDMILWLTTGEMGHALAAEDAELVEERDVRAGRETGRWIAPQIEEFISTLREGASQLEADERQEESTLRVELLTMLADWGQPHPQRNAETAQDRQVRKCVMDWESESVPLAAREPQVIEDVDVRLEAGTKWFFNQDLPRHSSGRGYVRVFSTPFRWTEEREGLQIVNAEGLASNMDLQRP